METVKIEGGNRILDTFAGLHTLTAGVFQHRYDTSPGAQDLSIITAPDGHILAIGEDWDGDGWGYTYCTYADAESLEHGEYDEHDGGATERELVANLARWMSAHDK